MKILYLTTEGFDTSGANNQMAMVMIREFLNSGHKVHLIQSRRTREFPDLPEMLKDKEGLTVDTVDRKVVGKKNFVIRYLDEVAWAFKSFSKWKKVKDIDVVFLQSCPTAIFQIILLKLFCHKPILFNIYDMWPGNLLELGITDSRVLVGAFRVIQKWAYSMCTKIAVLSEDMRDKLVAERVNDDKIIIVPAWFDDKVDMQIEDHDNKFMAKYNLQRDKFIVQFAGSIGYTFDYKIVLEAAELLKDDTGIVFEIIGDGSFKTDFVKEVEKRHLPNIIFFPMQPVSIVPDVYRACDVEMIPLRATTIGVGVPSKAPIVMACKRPIINAVEEESDYYRIFNERNMGISVPVGNAKEFASAILRLYKEPDTRMKMAENAWKYTNEYYSSTAGTQKFMTAFSAMERKVQ